MERVEVQLHEFLISVLAGDRC